MRLEPEDLKAIAAALADEIEIRRSGAVELPIGRLGFPEPEAAALIGVAAHVLRDCRLKGQLSARRVGRQVVYCREELKRFLTARTE